MDDTRASPWVVTAYLVCLVVSFSPLKAVAYMLPVLVLLTGTTFERRAWRFIRRPMLATVALVVVSAGHAVLYPDFIWSNAFAALITYSTLLFLAADFSRVATLPLIRRLTNLTVIWLTFQAVIGVGQALFSAAVVGGGSFDLAVGDAVKGTINPLPIGDGSGSNQMFAVLLSLYLIALYPNRWLLRSTTRRWMLPLIGVAWVLASVMHTVLFAAVAVLMAALISPVERRRRRFARMVQRGRLAGAAVAGALVLGGALWVFLPSNLQTLPHYVEQAVSGFRQPVDGVSPKVLATVNTIAVLPTIEPGQPVYGLGLGQYSSRAGLIMSGTYLSGDFYLPPRSRNVSYELIYQLQASIRGQNVGSTNFPYYSWLSVYGELGAIGLVLCLFWLSIVLRRARGAQSTPLAGSVGFGQSIAIAILYVAFLGLQDNYWEFAQAIFCPLFLLKLYYDYLKGQHRPKPDAVVSGEHMAEAV